MLNTPAPEYTGAITQVRAIRPFCLRGERQEAGTVLTLPAAEAGLLVADGRVELLDELARTTCVLAIKQQAGRAARTNSAGHVVPPSFY
jgi:hypothetical protein